MGYDLTSLGAFRDHGFDTVIDVRSPSEFAEDHVPGAINLPVLSDDERAMVGTVYKQESAFRARKIGAALVARNAARHIETALAEKDGSWRPLVYCWRGGQRSGSFAAILGQIGWRVEVLSGGYRTYRRAVVSALYDDPWPGQVWVLDGFTGTAKTAVLARLGERGAQVIDLEGLAEHRGSILGGRAAPQPSQKAFESGIAAALAAFDPARPVVVEAESSKVGDLIVPPSLWAAMSTAPRLVIEAPQAARARYLARAYRDLAESPEMVCALLERLVPYHGHAQVEEWQGLVRAGEAEVLAASLIALHYDSRYARSRARAEADQVETVSVVDLEEATLDRLAESLIGRFT